MKLIKINQRKELNRHIFLKAGQIVIRSMLRKARKVVLANIFPGFKIQRKIMEPNEREEELARSIEESLRYLHSPYFLTQISKSKKFLFLSLIYQRAPRGELKIQPLHHLHAPKTRHRAQKSKILLRGKTPIFHFFQKSPIPQISPLRENLCNGRVLFHRGKVQPKCFG